MAVEVGKLERKTQEFYAPAWCYTIPDLHSELSGGVGTRWLVTQEGRPVEST